VIDAPISETAIVGAACGMGYLGLRPIVEMQFIDFITCCFNQVTTSLPSPTIAGVRRCRWY
jgi:2-oxoisovalerate dehydrogenase E1 component beta subunit